MEAMLTTEYDGCGKCFVAARRLSRSSDASFSPERQQNQIIAAVTSVGGHVIAWADDWDTSGATEAATRFELGPWLRDEMGPYSGIVGADVDRIGREALDVLNTAHMIKRTGRLLVTYGHDGPWNLADPIDEARFMFEAMRAQMELRAIQKRNRDATAEARNAGRPRQKPPYGYRYVRLVPTGSVDHTEIDPVAAEIIRDVAERILSDDSGTVTVSTEAARLTRAGIPSPADHRAAVYGREAKGSPWTPKSLALILTSEASLGFQMHHGRPVLGPDGHPKQWADPLWDRATRDALVAKTAPKRKATNRAPIGVNLLAGLSFCATCGSRLYIAGRTGELAYGCTARVRGIVTSQHCKPAPSMAKSVLEAHVAEWFLSEYGPTPIFQREYDPGTGYAARIKEIEADRARLRDDRAAGLYDSPDDVEWFRTEYARMGREITALSALPDRPAGMYWRRTGQTVADQWHATGDDEAARRAILASYQVRVVLAPERGDKPRVWVHGLDAIAEADARQAAWEAYQEHQRSQGEFEDWQARHEADADHDREEYTRWTADNPDAPAPSPEADDGDLIAD